MTGRCDEEINFDHNQCPCHSHQNPFQDVWLHSQKELRGYQLNDENNERYLAENGRDKFSQVEQDGYTFPPCNPEKRIDYIMVRNNTTPLNGKTKKWSSQILSSWLVGKEVTSETGNKLLLLLLSLLPSFIC